MEETYKHFPYLITEKKRERKENEYRCIESRESVDEAKRKTNVHVKHCANNARMRDGFKQKYDEQVLCAKVTNKCIRSTLRLSIDVVRMIQTQKSELKHRK